MAESGFITRRNILRAGGAAGLATVIQPIGGAQAAEPLTVRIAGTTGNLPSVLEYMAQQGGYFGAYGLTASYSNVADGNRIIGSIVSGDADLCMLAGFAPVPIAVEKGAKMKLIAGATLLLNQCVFSKRPDIKTVKDLEGKTVGVGSLGSLLHQLMMALLKKKGVDTSTVRFVNVGNNTDVFRAVVAGVVDAGPSTIDVYDKQQQYGVHNLTDGEFWIQLPEYTQQGSFASDQAIATKRDMLVKVLAAYAKLYRYLQTPDSKDAFIKARSDLLGKKTDAADSLFQWNWIRKYKPFATNLVLSDERIQYIENINIESHAQSKLLPMSQLADMSLANEALKLLG